MKHTLSVLVENKPGVLTRVAGLFARRGFNIQSLAVGESEDPQLSRMTITIDGAEHPIDQVTKQLHKLINVVKIRDLDPQSMVAAELMLVKVAAEGDKRNDVLQIAEIFKAKIVDVDRRSLVLRVVGATDKLEALLALLQPIGVLEVTRTGDDRHRAGTGLAPRPRLSLRRAADSAQASSARRRDLRDSARPPGTRTVGRRGFAGRMGGMRPATTDDTQTLVDLMAEFYAESGFVLDRRHTAAAFSALLGDPRLGRVWLIERDAASPGMSSSLASLPWSTAGSRPSSTTSTCGRRFAARAPARRRSRRSAIGAQSSACAPCRSRWATRTSSPNPRTGTRASS